MLHQQQPHSSSNMWRLAPVTRAAALLSALASIASYPHSERCDQDLAGKWRHGRHEIYTVTRKADPGDFSVVAADCPHCAWHTGTLQLHQLDVSAHYDCGLNTTGTLNYDCTSITWSDKSQWLKDGQHPVNPPQPPPPPLPRGAIDPETIHTVLVMQSCHLDVGFADFSTNIINRFWHQHFPTAIESARQLKQRGGPEQLVFAVRTKRCV